MKITNSTITKHWFNQLKTPSLWSLPLFFFLLSFSIPSYALDVTVSSTPTTCGSGNNGTATATPIDGWDPYTYTWSNGATTQTITDLSPGTYSVTVVDVDGAIAVGSTVVGSLSSDIQLFLSSSYETCTGSADGTASVNVSGGTGNLDFLWSDGQTFVVASGLSAGTYTVTVTDENGCSAVGSVDVELSPEGIWLMIMGTDADCGQENGTAHVSVMTGVGPYTYIWDDPAMQTTADPVGLAPGTYTVTVTDSNGCTNAESVTIDQNSDLSVSVTGTNATCNNSDGTATANVTGGNGPFTYAWDNGGTTQTITGLAPGTYSVTVTDSGGCVGNNSGSVTITGPSGGQITTNDPTEICIDATPDPISVVITGTAGANSQWIITDAAGTILALPAGPPFDLNGAGPGVCLIWHLSYDGTITGLTVGSSAFDIQGCLELSNSITVTRYEAEGGQISTMDDTNICIDNTPDPINVTLTGNLGADSQWVITDAAGNILGLPAGPPFDLNGAGPGVCLIWHLSSSGPLSGVAVGNNTANLVGCYEFSNSITVTRTSTDGGEIMTGDPTTICVDNTPDPISVTVTGAVGSNAQWIITDDMGNILALPAGPPFDLNGAGVGVCQIWYLRYEDGLTGLMTGNNTADLMGCFDLSNPITVTRIVCCEAMAGALTNGTAGCLENGSATISATPDGNAVVPAGYQTIYVLTSGAGLVIQDTDSSPSFNVAAAGMYTIHTLVYDPNTLDLSTINLGVTTGFDVNALLIQGGGTICAALDVAGAPITVNETIDLTLNPSNISCFGAADGSVSSTVSGGSGSYTYAWSNSTNGIGISSLAPGTYGLTVTDTDGCTASASVTITQPTELTVSVTGTNETCIGSNDGTATASANGGTAGYNYAWSNGGSGSMITNLAPGTYDVTVTDANGCTATGSVDIASDGITSCSASVTSSYNEGVDISTFGGSDGTASASVSGGTMPFTYAWSNGQNGPDASNLSAGTVSVIITDANGCNCMADVTLVDPSKVGNFVWEDTNENGVQNGGEAGIPGVEVTLTGTSDAGVAVDRNTTTDANGLYLFDGLPAGDYKVTFGRPSGYKASASNAGGDNTLDSDADPMTGMTEVFSLAAATCDLTVDAGFYPCVTIGDFVFYDGNRDGIQQPWEAGFAGAIVDLMMAGPDGVMCTNDDVVKDSRITGGDGLYLFECVDPGQYYIRFGISGSEYTITDQNQGGNDELDSDADPLTGKTAPFSVVDGMPDNLSYDAGVYLICDDFNVGGAIGNDQTICPGEFADPLVSITLPSGGFGMAEYLWLQSSIGGPLTNYTPIPNSNSPTYDPGQVTSTTFFIRCARRAGCGEFVTESNPVKITVVPSDSPLCNGIFPMTSNLTANLADSQVELEWTSEPEMSLYNYHIERSADGINFHEVDQMVGKGIQNGTNRYNFRDELPRMGNNVYRIKRIEMASGIQLFSNEVSVMMSDGANQFFTYPNPVLEELNLEPFTSVEKDAVVRLFNSTGQLLQVVNIEAGKEAPTSINMKSYTSGLYFIHIKIADQETEVMSVFKQE